MPSSPTNGSQASANYQVTDGGGNVATSTQTTYTYVVIQNEGSAWVPVKTIEGYGGSTSYTTNLQLFPFGILTAGKTDPMGAVTAQSFAGAGSYLYQMPSSTYVPWNNNVPTNIGTDSVNANGSAETDYTYQSDWSGNPVLPISAVTTVGTTRLKSVSTVYHFTGDGSGQSFFANGENIVIADANETVLGTSTQLTVTTNYRPDGDTLHSQLPYSVQRPDGTMTDYSYDLGTLFGRQLQYNQRDGCPGDPIFGVMSRPIPLACQPNPGATVLSNAPVSGTQIDLIGLIANRSAFTVDIWQGGLLVHHENRLSYGWF